MKSILFFLSFLYFSNLYAQDYCLYLTDYISIENSENVPTVIDNGDGTVSLEHSNPEISSTFEPYIIFDFEQTSPSSYILRHSSRQLIMDIQANFSSDVFLINENYTSEFPFVDDFISFIEGKQLKYRGSTDFCENEFNCPIPPLPAGFDFSVLFTFNEAMQTLFLETTSPTPCGNEFKVGFKPGYDQMDGGSSEGTIQEWNIEPITVSSINPDAPCHSLEMQLYEFLGIGCDNTSYFGNMRLIYISSINKLRFARENVFGTTTIVEFKDPALAIHEHSLNNVFFIQEKGTEYVNIINPSGLNFSGVIYSLNGKVINTINEVKNNAINISKLHKNTLYLLKLFTDNEEVEVFKFVKR